MNEQTPKEEETYSIEISMSNLSKEQYDNIMEQLKAINKNATKLEKHNITINSITPKNIN
jgi:uncharacterized Zn finger protein